MANDGTKKFLDNCQAISFLLFIASSVILFIAGGVVYAQGTGVVYLCGGTAGLYSSNSPFLLVKDCKTLQPATPLNNDPTFCRLVDVESNTTICRDVTLDAHSKQVNGTIMLVVAAFCGLVVITMFFYITCECGSDSERPVPKSDTQTQIPSVKFWGFRDPNKYTNTNITPYAA